ncbi:MAG: SRPBCC family protein [Actinobacteria bacterium]|nr:SRPBCC family protein [Actinomycetota bacterium]
MTSAKASDHARTPPREILVRSCVEIEATIAQVWAVLADHDYDVRWRTGVDRAVQVPAGPVVQGARVTEHSWFLGRCRVREAIVGEVVPERRFTWTAGDGAMAGSRSVRLGRSDFVWVELQTILRPSGPLQRLIWALFASRLQRESDRSAQRLEALFDGLLLESA